MQIEFISTREDLDVSPEGPRDNTKGTDRS